jgi:hypothetical protein
VDLKEDFQNERSACLELTLDSGIDPRRYLERFLEGGGSLVFGKEQRQSLVHSFPLC